jgi:hypothetical protein
MSVAECRLAQLILSVMLGHSDSNGESDIRDNSCRRISQLGINNYSGKNTETKTDLLRMTVFKINKKTIIISNKLLIIVKYN